jgi:hypothetical protein
MRFLAILCYLVPVCLPPQTAAADPSAKTLHDKYHVTDQERAACSGDALRLCSQAYPDEDALILCMKANRSMLSNACVVAFDAGLRKRRL